LKANGVVMSLENEMRNEVVRLETEIAQIDNELQKLNTKIVNLINIKKKKEHDLSVLKANFDEIEDREIQTSLERLLKNL
jgi:predicted nuclease with TOPRIM domain